MGVGMQLTGLLMHIGARFLLAVEREADDGRASPAAAATKRSFDSAVSLVSRARPRLVRQDALDGLEAAA